MPNEKLDEYWSNLPMFSIALQSFENRQYEYLVLIYFKNDFLKKKIRFI